MRAYLERGRGVRAGLALVVACGALAPFGCLSQRSVPRTIYYTLSPTGAPAAPLPGPVRVGSFSADEPYASVRLAYRSSPYRIEYYNFHRWAGSPASLVSGALRDFMARAPAVEDGPPLLITGHLRRLEELDLPEMWEGAVEFDVRVERGGVPWFERAYGECVAASARNPEAVVAAMSRALTKILEDLAADLSAPPGADVAPARPGCEPFPHPR